MSDRDYCMTAIEVEVLRTFIVPYMAAFSFDNIDVKKGYTSNSFILSVTDYKLKIL